MDLPALPSEATEPRERPEAMVCTLHRGLTQGLLDAIAPNTELVGFVPRDPDMAGCLMELRGELADEGRGRAAAVASERPAG